MESLTSRLPERRNIRIYRTPLFEKCCAQMTARGGIAMEAVRKLDEILSNLLAPDAAAARQMFRYTRQGENRIRYCRKIALGSGFRAVLLERDNRVVFLFAGSHDECDRWIMRHRRADWDFDDGSESAVPESAAWTEDTEYSLREELYLERQWLDRYEAEINARMDEAALLNIFKGWRKDLPA